jgi:hypothetical protein
MSPTPILDRQQPARATNQRKTHRGRWLALGAAIGLLLVFLPSNLQRPLNWLTPIVLLFFIIALFCGILIHETGHLVAGLAVGFEFRRILVGPLMLTRELRGYRLRFVPNRLLAGGYVFMVPRQPVNLRRRFAIFGAGGPLATALAFLPIVLLPWGPIAGSLLLANVLLAFSSWIPREIRGHYTDAKNIQILSRAGPAADRLVAVIYLMTLDGLGIHPSEWPSEVVANLAVPGGDHAYRAGGRIFLHIYARETAPPGEVAIALESVLELSGELRGDLRRMYFAEATFWQGVTNRNATLARAWLEDARAVKDALTQKDWDACALAAIAFAEGEQAEFRAHLARALAHLDRQPGPSGSVAAARARLIALEGTV